MGAAAAAILIKERHIVEAFERAGAVSPARALPLVDVPVDPGGLAMRRLRSRAVLREAAPGMFYADLEVFRAVRRTRRRLIAVILLVVTVLFVVPLVVSSLRSAYDAGRAAGTRDSPRSAAPGPTSR